MYDLLIKNGQIATPQNLVQGSVAIKEGKIDAVFAAEDNINAAEIIDAQDKLIFPGLIDCHVHFNDPGFEWREDFIHGSMAAAAGGITTVIDMPLQNKPSTTTTSSFRAKKEYLASRSVIDYALWGGLIDNNLAEIGGMAKEGAIGLKAFLSPTSPDYTKVSIGLLREALKIAADLKIVVAVHCEDASIITYEEEKAKKEGRSGIDDYLSSRPPQAEIIAVENVINLVRETRAKVHVCHVSHPQVAAKIKAAQNEGLPVSAETCPHYLLFNADHFRQNGPLFKCAPPLRSKEESAQLWDYIDNGSLRCIASDHSPCVAKEKETVDIWQAWGGISGVQTSFQVMFDAMVNKRNLGPEKLVSFFATNPALIFGLDHRKGSIFPGKDADLIIVDPQKPWKIDTQKLYYKNKITAFEGLSGKGVVEKTIVRGKVVFEKGEIKAEPGHGVFISPSF